SIVLPLDSHFEDAFRPFRALGMSPGRVAVEHRGRYVLLTEAEDGDVDAELAGRLRHDATSRADLPCVGDWVAYRSSTIHALLPRRTAFVRAAAGGNTEPQVVAANVDVAIIVCVLDRDFSVARIERYLAVAHASGADAVVALTKSDLLDDADACVAEAAR